MQEIWKPIKNYEGLYSASNTGKIKSLHYKHKNMEKTLNLSKQSCGYLKVELYKNGKSKIYYVHRLIAETFIQNPDNLPQVNHIDGNKLNNNVNNLEWVTASQNQIHAVKNRLHAPSYFKGKFGSESLNSKQVLQYDLFGNFIKLWCCRAEASRFYNCNQSSINNCVAGRTKTCKGFMWKYYNGGEIPLKISPLKI